MHMLGRMVVQILILQDYVVIDNSVNYLKFLNKILLWSWYLDLVTQPFSVCFLCEATSVSLLPGEVNCMFLLILSYRFCV